MSQWHTDSVDSTWQRTRNKNINRNTIMKFIKRPNQIQMKTTRKQAATAPQSAYLHNANNWGDTWWQLIKQLAQLWQRPQRDRESFAISRGWLTLKLNFGSKGYILRQYLRTVRWGNGYTTLLLEVFTQRNCVADFMRLKLNFIF